MAGKKRNTSGATDSWRTLRQRLRLECRECEVICERVVSPWHCLTSSCPFVYAYEELDTSYFGCLHKIFTPELDLAPFLGARKKGRRATDPYGHLRAARLPRPECEANIEQAYGALATPGCCCNPTFFLDPGGSSEDTIRLTTNVMPDADPGLQK